MIKEEIYTESYENERIPKVSTRQSRVIAAVLSSNSIEGGLRIARVSKASYYKWLRNPDFQDELQRQQSALVTSALDALKGLAGRAVETLEDLLKTGAESNKLRAAITILEHIQRFLEIEKLEQRMKNIEEVINNEQH